MSVSDVTARIAQLQGQFSLMTTGSRVGTQVLGGETNAAFAQALNGAAATSTATGTTGPTPTSGPWAPSGPSSTATGATGSAATGQAVVAEARKYLGVPYVWGGTNPRTGLDCSGLVQHVYGQLGIDLPRVSYQQAQAGRPVANLSQARPGDLLAFGSPRVHHIGIYIGDGRMIEAPRPGLQVRVMDVYETPSHIRRVLPDAPATAAAQVAGVQRLALPLPAGTPYAGLFEAAQAKYGVPASLLAAVARQESAFDPAAVSPAGARGLMQIMPATARGLDVDPMRPEQAVDGAARMLRDLIGRFGRVDHALAAYNAGPGAVLRHDGIPPYPETQRYVPAVLRFQRELEAA